MVSWAEQKVPSGIAALIIGAVPLFMVVVEALRPGGARPGWQSLLGILIGFGGIALLVGPDQLSGSAGRFDLAGVGALLLASLLWSIGSVYSKSAELPVSSLMATSTEMLSAAVALYLVATLTGEWQRLDLAAIAPSSWWGLAYLTLFGSMIAFGAYAWLLRHAPISLVSTYAYVNPVVAIFLGALVAGEVLNGRILFAALIIIGSVVLINTSKQAGAIQEDEAIAAAAE
jgi:drug/metabolite transporter (DMT)-like permease